jgi:hypothetical protein
MKTLKLVRLIFLILNDGLFSLHLKKFMINYAKMASLAYLT